MEPANPFDENIVSSVRAHPALVAVLRELYLFRDKPGITQADLARLAGLSFGHIGDHVRALQVYRLARCTNAALRKGKPYRITVEGVGAWESIQFVIEQAARQTEVNREGKVSKL